MSINGRKQNEKDKLRRKILNTARDIVIGQGINKLTMRAIAKKINYSPTTIYLYFKNKEELTFHLLEYSFQILVEALQKGDLQTFPDSLARLKAGLTVYINNGLKNPNFYKIMTTTVLKTRDPEMILKKGSMNEKSFLMLQKGVELCLKDKKLKQDNPFNIAKTLWVAIHGITMLIIDTPEFPWGDKDQFISNYLDVLIKGLK